MYWFWLHRLWISCPGDRCEIVSLLNLNSALQDSLSLEKLNLTGNNVTGVGALHMARMLIDNDYISELVCSESQRPQFLAVTTARFKSPKFHSFNHVIIYDLIYVIHWMRQKDWIYWNLEWQINVCLFLTVFSRQSVGILRCLSHV